MRTRAGIYLSIGGLMILLWGVAGYLPLKRSEAQVLSEISTGRAQLTEFEQTMRTLPSFIRKSHELERMRKKLNSSLYAKSEIIDLLQQLHQEANSLGMNVTEITPPVEELLKLNQVMEDADSPPFLNLTLSLTGNYVGFGKYVRWLEHRPYFRGVNTCMISGNPSGKQPVIYAVGFRALLGGKGA